LVILLSLLYASEWPTFQFGKMDSSTELTTNKSNLQLCADPLELQDQIGYFILSIRLFSGFLVLTLSFK